MQKDTLREMEAQIAQGGSLTAENGTILLAAYKALQERNEKLWEALHQAGKVVSKEATDGGIQSTQPEQHKKNKWETPKDS